MALPKDPMLDVVDCEGCHDLSEPTSIEAIDSMCMECHDDEEERYEGMLAGWSSEIDALLKQAEQETGKQQRDTLDALRTAGPLHNVEATRKIIQALLADPTGASTMDDDAS